MEADLEKKQPEMRKVERRHLVFYLRVFDGGSSKVLGHIVDISAQGVMLVSDKPVPVDVHYQLRMRLPSEVADREEIVFAATSRWCKKDVNPDFFIIGFEMDELDPEIEKYIISLIEDFSYNDTV